MLNRGRYKWMTGFVAMVIASLSVISFLPQDVSADGSIQLSLTSSTSTVNPGDIVSISISCDEFDSVSEFGPVQLSYDPEQFSFVSVTSADVLSGYTFDIDSSEDGTVLVSADFVEVIDEETGNEVAPFDAEVQTVLFQLSLRAKTESSGDTVISMASTGTFTRSDNTVLTSYGAEPVTINIAHGVSTDATLSALSLEGITMTPAFDPQVFEYSATVSRDIDSVTVNAVPNNLQATISIDGADELTSGENIVSVHVLAQDGIRWRDYRIYVSRQENYIPEGSGFVDKYGITYTFMTFPTNLELPAGFLQTTRTINGYAVPVFAKDGIVSVLVYVYNGTDEPSLYFYNPVSGIATRYRPDDTVIMIGHVLTECPIPEDLPIPRGFVEHTMEIDGKIIEGYIDKDDDFICYMSDDNGNSSFYYYDPDTGSFYQYKSVEQTAENVYRSLFYLFITVSVIQSSFIVVMAYAIRRIVSNRANPRPKRV